MWIKVITKDITGQYAQYIIKIQRSMLVKTLGRKSVWIQQEKGSKTMHTTTQATACTYGPLCILIAKWMIWDYPS